MSGQIEQGKDKKNYTLIDLSYSYGVARGISKHSEATVVVIVW